MRAPATKLLLVGLLALLAPGALARGQAPFDYAFRVEPETVEVGQPFELLLGLRHERGALVPALDASALSEDPAWAVLDERREPAVPDPESEGFAWTRFRLTLVSLEPGTHPVPLLELRLGGEPLRPFPDLEPEQVLESLPRIEVAGVLAEDEDEPRPIRGLEAVTAHPGGREGGERYLLPGLGLAALLVALGAWLLLRRGPSSGPAATATPLEVFARLEREVGLGGGEAGGPLLRDPERVRALHYELTGLVRGAIDRECGVERAALSDDEWLAVVLAEQRIDAVRRQTLEELLRRCREVKYAGSVPTEWAVRETFAGARRALNGAVVGGDPERRSA